MDQLHRITQILGTPSKESWPVGWQLQLKLNMRLPQHPGVGLSSVFPSASKPALKVKAGGRARSVGDNQSHQHFT